MTGIDWAQDQDSLLTRLGQQKSVLAQVEETLRLQRQNLDVIVAALQETRPSDEAAKDVELQKLRLQNEEMHQMLTALESERQRTDQTTEARLAEQTSEIALLRKSVEEKDGVLQQMRDQPAAAPSPPRDIDTFEAELNEFQRQLEADRQKLNREFEQMRVRNQELDEATRETELEMSRERAELARERQRLDRLREDVRVELDRLQREGGLRERLTPVQNLRDTINNRRAPANDQTPKPNTADPVNARLRALLKQDH
jgi:chromosome segregation ATPase